MRKKQLIVLIAIVLVALGVRVWKLNSVPSSLYVDEIDLGYQARSLVETGRDYRGGLSPFFVKSFNSDRTPIPAILTAITTAIFKTPELAIRMAPAILGTIGVVLSYLLVNMWIGMGPALVTAMAMALSPWMIQFGRIGFEATSVMVILLGGLTSFFYWLKNKKKEKFFWLAVILLSLSMYTYRTMSLLTPIIFLILLTVYHQEIFKLEKKKLLIAAGLAGIIMGSFLYATTLASADETRISQISILADPETAIWVQRDREIASGDLNDNTVGKQATLTSKIFYNKPLSWADSLLNNYLTAFSTDFLFINGDPNLRQSIPGWGMMIWLDVIAIGFGIYFFVKKRKQKWVQLLTLWLLTSPLASCLTTIGGNHAHRLFVMAIPLLVLTGIGWYQFGVSLWSTKAKKFNYGKILVVATALIWLGWWSRFYQSYMVHYPISSSRWFGGGYKEAMLTIKEVEDDYEAVRLTDSLDPPMLYYFWWTEVPPKAVQEYGSNFSEEVYKGTELDKVKPINWQEEMKKEKCQNWDECIKEGTLYLLSTNEVKEDLRTEKPPKGIKLIKTILYPDKEPAFYLISR